MTRLEAFLEALPHARDEEFVNAPGLGVFKAKYVRRGLERKVIVVHGTGFGLCFAQPTEHGACGFCRGARGTQPCEHCACALCSWFRQTDERASPQVSREKWLRLMARLKTFTVGSALPSAPAPLDGEV